MNWFGKIEVIVLNPKKTMCNIGLNGEMLKTMLKRLKSPILTVFLFQLLSGNKGKAKLLNVFTGIFSADIRCLAVRIKHWYFCGNNAKILI